MTPATIAFFSRALSAANGVDQLATDIALGLASADASVTVVTQEEVVWRDLPEELTRERSRLHFLPLPADVRFPTTWNMQSARRVAQWMKWSVLDVPRRSELRKVSPDLVVVNDLGSSEYWLRSGIRSAAAPMLIVHASPRHFGPPYQAKPITWALERMRTYSSFVFVSSRCRDEWIALDACGDRPTFYVPNCCNEAAVARVMTEERAAVRRRLGFSEDALVAVCVASIQHRKGQDLIVDQFPRLLDVAPNLHVYFVGGAIPSTQWVRGSADYAERLRAAAQVAEHRGRLTFCGPKRNALEYIYAADLLLLPARAEAMPLTILEAMALGTPVVASNVDGIPEMIDDAVNGLLFDPQQPAGLIDSVAAAAGSADARRQWAARAREKYQAQFSRAQLIERYGDVVRQVMPSREAMGAHPRIVPDVMQAP